MEDNLPSSSPASSGISRGSKLWGSKLFRGLISGVLVGALVLGAVYYLHFGREQASERTPPPTSTAEAPASQPSAPDQPASAPKAPEAQAKAAPAPSAPSPNEQATSPMTPAPGVPTEGPAKPQDQANLNAGAAKPDQPKLTDGAAKPDRPNLNDSAAKPDQPNPNDRATKPDPAPAPPLRDQTASLPAAEVVFVQRARVKIRSAPNAHAKIVGSATKGQQFTVTRRAGRWLQVDTGNGLGWISASLLGSQSP